MMIRRLSLNTLLFSALLLPALPSFATPDTFQDRPAYLISQNRSVDAADWVETSPHPSDLKTLCARAVLDLYAGQIGQAKLAFSQIQVRTPESEAFSEYGLALCDMSDHDPIDASVKLKSCRLLDSGNTYAIEIQEAQAVLAQSKTDFSMTTQLTSADDSLLVQEMSEIASLKTVSAAGTLNLQQSPVWWLTGGVPRVVELPGLQAVGAMQPGLAGPILVGSLKSSTDGNRIIQRLDGVISSQSTDAQKASGEITISPVYKFDTSDNNWIASYSLDGNTDAVVNTGIRSWDWDTRASTNGLHVIAITLDNAALNQHLSETRYYDVDNKEPRPLDNQSSSIRPTQLSPPDQIVIKDSWDLLRIQPSFRPAELLLGKICRERGFRSLALQHDSIAAALDESNSHDQISEISHAYAGRIPAWYKLPPGAHIAEHVHGGGRSYLSQGIWRGTTAVREIALTFDDGPSGDHTPALLDALESVKCPATFMVVGIRAEQVPDILRRMASDGDEVEDHTYTHPNLDEATPDHIYEEILRDAAIVQACTGVWPHFLRPPGGQSNPNVLQTAQQLGLTGALWTIDVLPAEDSGSPQSVIDLVLKKAVPGAIVLLHNGTYASTEAVPALVNALRARGYKLVTLLQIAKDTPGVAQ